MVGFSRSCDGEGASGPGLGPCAAGRGWRGRVSDLEGRGVLDGEPQKTEVGCELSTEQKLQLVVQVWSGTRWCRRAIAAYRHRNIYD